MALKDDLDESSFSANSDLGIDNVGLNIDKYLDEIEKTLAEKSRSVPRSLPGSSSGGYSNSTVESKIYTRSIDDNTYQRYSPEPSFSGIERVSMSNDSKQHFVTSIVVEPDAHGLEGMVSCDSGSNLQLIWRNLIYFAKPLSCFSSAPRNNRKVILEKQSGSICGGTITAIIGPSGAGKSTLLECLAGRRKTGLKGDIFVSVDKSTRRSANVKVSLIGQRDEAIYVLTVKEVLTFASRIKNYTRSDNNYYTPRLVASVLEELNLEKCADTKVAKISGGQLKRLVFGVELISGPDIILLDEPTSGLDASSAYSCVKLLKKLTDLKRNIYNKDSFKAPAIICSIHQPSARVMNHFHKIYVLSSDGRCIYQGSPSRLLGHLSKFDLVCPQFHNPADFIIEIASGDYGLEPINKLALDESDRQMSELRTEKLITVGSGRIAVGMPKDRNIYMKISKVIDRMKNQSFPTFRHTFLLWQRTLITNLREPKLTWFRLFQAVFIAVLMSFLYDHPIGQPDGCYPRADQAVTEFKSTEDNIAFIFFITLFTVMASMMPTVLTFPSEVAILIQERNNGWYSCATYYTAKIIAELPLQIIITLTFIAIIYPMTGQIMEWHRFGYFCLICLLTSSIAQCVGIMFGTYYVKSVENAVFLAPLSMAPVFLLSGFFGKLSTIPAILKPIAYTSYVRYAFEALLIILYGMNRCSPPSSSSSSLPLSSSLSPSSPTSAAASPVASPSFAMPQTIPASIAAKIIQAAGSDAIPSHLLNTGYVSGNEIDNANRQLRKNMSRIGAYRFNPNPQIFWEGVSSTVSPLSDLITTTVSSSLDQQSDPHKVLGVSNAADLSSLLSTVGGNSTFASAQDTLFPEGSYVLKRFDVSEETFFVNLIILVAFLVTLRILCYIILLVKTNERK